MRNSARNYADMLDLVFPEYPRISTAPKGPQDIPAYWELPRGKAIDDFEEAWAKEEAQKIYKAIDSRTGEVYLMRNPAVPQIAIRLDYPPPKRPPAVATLTYSKRNMGHIDDLIQQQKSDPATKIRVVSSAEF